MRTPTTLSLFTGAGGLDLGLEAAGFTNLAAVEVMPAAVRTLELNRARWGRILPIDIHSLIDYDAIPGKQGDRLIAAAGVKPGSLDLLVGGPPCQPFSKSGYWARGDSRRLEDPRAKTLDAYLAVLEAALPEVFLIENVPGLAFSAKAEGIEYLRQRVNQINERTGARYSFCATQLNAARYGVPQLRERVFIVGHRGGLPFVFPDREFALPGEHAGLAPGLTTWDAIGHLSEDGDADATLRVKGKWASVLPTIPEGKNYLWHTNRGGGLPLWGWRTRYWSMLLKVAKNLPSWTLTAQPGPAIGPFHWRSRRFSAQELAALQTFPADYQIVGNVAEAHMQLGNAVPSLLTEVIGRAMLAQFFDARVHSPLKLLPKRQTSIPPPEPVVDPSTLPSAILDLVGDYPDHPGTGLGPSGLQEEVYLREGR